MWQPGRNPLAVLPGMGASVSRDDVSMSYGREGIVRKLFKGPAVAHRFKWFDKTYQLFVRHEIIRVWRDHDDGPRMIELTEKGRQWAALHGVKDGD